jgi:hypothetical protein
MGRLYDKILLQFATQLCHARKAHINNGKHYDKNIFCESQGGFVTGRGALEQVFSFLTIKEHCRLMKSNLLAVFLDVRKAYDSVNFEYAIGRMNLLCPELCGLLKTWLQGRSITFKGDPEQRRIHLMRGVPQGSPFSPFVFNTVIDGFSHKLMETSLGVHIPPVGKHKERIINHELFADNALLLETSVERMELLIACGSQWAREAHMIFNPSDSALMVMGSSEFRKEAAAHTFEFDKDVSYTPEGGPPQNQIPIVETKKYLGVVLRSKGVQWGTEDLVEKMNSMFFHQISGRGVQKSVPVMTGLYLSCVLGSALYGTELQGIDLEKANIMHRRIVRFILRVYQKNSPRRLRGKLLGIENCDIYVTGRRARLFSRLSHAESPMLSHLLELGVKEQLESAKRLLVSITLVIPEIMGPGPKPRSCDFNRGFRRYVADIWRKSCSRVRDFRAVDVQSKLHMSSHLVVYSGLSVRPRMFMPPSIGPLSFADSELSYDPNKQWQGCASDGVDVWSTDASISNGSKIGYLGIHLIQQETHIGWRIKLDCTKMKTDMDVSMAELIGITCCYALAKFVPRLQLNQRRIMTVRCDSEIATRAVRGDGLMFKAEMGVVIDLTRKWWKISSQCLLKVPRELNRIADALAGGELLMSQRYCSPVTKRIVNSYIDGMVPFLKWMEKNTMCSLSFLSADVLEPEWIPFSPPFMGYYGMSFEGQLEKKSRPVSNFNCTLKCCLCGALEGNSRHLFRFTVCHGCLWSVQDAAVYVYRVHMPLVFPKIVDGKSVAQKRDCYLCGAKDMDSWDHLLQSCNNPNVVRIRLEANLSNIGNVHLPKIYSNEDLAKFILVIRGVKRIEKIRAQVRDILQTQL